MNTSNVLTILILIAVNARGYCVTEGSSLKETISKTLQNHETILPTDVYEKEDFVTEAMQAKTFIDLFGNNDKNFPSSRTTNIYEERNTVINVPGSRLLYDKPVPGHQTGRRVYFFPQKLLPPEIILYQYNNQE